MSHCIKIMPALIFKIFLAAPAHASSLAGDLLQAKYYFPDVNTVYDQATVPSPFTVGLVPDPTITVEGVTTLLMHFSDAALLITLNTVFIPRGVPLQVRTAQASRSYLATPFRQSPASRRLMPGQFPPISQMECSSWTGQA